MISRTNRIVSSQYFESRFYVRKLMIKFEIKKWKLNLLEARLFFCARHALLNLYSYTAMINQEFYSI